MKRKIRNTSFAIATILSALTLVSSTNAAVISDDFSILKPPSAGQGLTGQVTPVGGETWQELWPTVVFGGSSNGYITNAFAEGGGGFVSLSSITPGNTQFTLSGSINPEGMGSTGYASLGFSSTISSPVNTGEIWSLLSVAGDYAVFLNGVGTLVSSGSAPGFVSNGFNEVSMTLDTTTSFLNVSINNIAVVTNYNIGFTPTLNLAGFSFVPAGVGATTQTAQFDNFVVSSAVPEPSTVALVGASIAGGLLLRRRTRK